MEVRHFYRHRTDKSGSYWGAKTPGGGGLCLWRVPVPYSTLWFSFIVHLRLSGGQNQTETRNQQFLCGLMNMPLWYTRICSLKLEMNHKVVTQPALNSWQSAIMLIYRSKSLIFLDVVLWMLVLIRVTWITSELSALIYNFNNSSNSNHNNLVNKPVHQSARQSFKTKMEPHSAKK